MIRQTLYSRKTGEHRPDLRPGEVGPMPAPGRRAFERKGRVEAPHRLEANRATRSFAVTAPGQSFEKRATRLYKIARRLLPSKLLLKFCVAPYQLGVFCLKVYEVFLHNIKLSAHKGEVLLEGRAALNVSERGDQVTKDAEIVSHEGSPLAGEQSGDAHSINRCTPHQFTATGSATRQALAATLDALTFMASMYAVWALVAVYQAGVTP